LTGARDSSLSLCARDYNFSFKFLINIFPEKKETLGQPLPVFHSISGIPEKKAK